MWKEIVIEILHDNMQIDFYFFFAPRLRLCLFLLFDTLDYELFRSIMFLFSLYVSFDSLPGILRSLLSPSFFRWIFILFPFCCRLRRCLFISRSPSSSSCVRREFSVIIVVREAAPLNWYLMFTICKTKEIFNYHANGLENNVLINDIDMVDSKLI